MRKNKWIWLIVIVIALLFGWRIFLKIQASGSNGNAGAFGGNRKGKQAVAVETGKVVQMDLADLAAFSGTLIAGNKVIITAKTPGQLSKLMVNIGDKVYKGQTIAELDDRLYVQEFEKAKATAEQTLDAYTIAQKDLANLQSLLRKNYISQADYDKANSDFVASKSRNDIAQAARNTAEIQLSYTKIKADWNGPGKYRVIGEKFVDEGAMLSNGTAIVSMLDISTLIAVIDVIESDYTKIRIGQPVRITTDSYPGQVFTGKVARIAPMLSETSRQARTEIEVPNPQTVLKPGMYARVQINYLDKKNVTAVPLAALTTNKDTQGVYLVDTPNQKVKFIPVQTGIRNAEFAEIISPRLEGEVVTLGQDQLDDGSAILLPNAKGNKPARQKSGARG